MKKMFISGVVISIMLGCFFFFSSPAFATEDQAKAKAVAAFLAVRSQGYNAVDGSAGLLEPGQMFAKEMYLMAGKKYLFLAAGCNDAIDIDIAIFNSSGNMVAADTDSDDLAVASFVPARSGNYKIVTILDKAIRGGAHVFFLACVPQ